LDEIDLTAPSVRPASQMTDDERAAAEAYIQENYPKQGRWPS
jgi:hypothetical protein